MATETSSGGMGFFGFLALLFIALKLTGYVTWSWVWVLSPIWAPLLIVVAILAIAALVAALVFTYEIMTN